MGIIGAAIASGLGQVLTVLVLLTHFLRRKGDLRIGAFRINGALVEKVCKTGCAGGGHATHYTCHGALL